MSLVVVRYFEYTKYMRLTKYDSTILNIILSLLMFVKYFFFFLKRYRLDIIAKNFEGKFVNINKHCLFDDGFFIFLFSRNKYNLTFLDIITIICSDAFNVKRIYGIYICIMYIHVESYFSLAIKRGNSNLIG